jgi:hypothetical protein
MLRRREDTRGHDIRIHRNVSPSVDDLLYSVLEEKTGQLSTQRKRGHSLGLLAIVENSGIVVRPV